MLNSDTPQDNILRITLSPSSPESTSIVSHQLKICFLDTFQLSKVILDIKKKICSPPPPGKNFLIQYWCNGECWVGIVQQEARKNWVNVQRQSHSDLKCTFRRSNIKFLIYLKLKTINTFVFFFFYFKHTSVVSINKFILS